MMRPDFIETHSGRAFRPLTPNSDQITIEDIAHALSQQCRFSGHTREYYSVAQHSIHVSELLRSWACSKEVQLWGLLHDASEAYLVDIPSPLKSTDAFSEYRAAEDRLMSAVVVRFGLLPVQPPVVHLADMTMLATEARDLMPFVPEHWGGLTCEPLEEVITPWHSHAVKTVFLSMFEELAA